ncbi:hypothetical protein HDV00_004849 [Rhizophlyctis rosea]|nr:hypothetical protein HDV00_004849 [Rhizophlyctis rosea]
MITRNITQPSANLSRLTSIPMEIHFTNPSAPRLSLEVLLMFFTFSHPETARRLRNVCKATRSFFTKKDFLKAELRWRLHHRGENVWEWGGKTGQADVVKTYMEFASEEDRMIMLADAALEGHEEGQCRSGYPLVEAAQKGHIGIVDRLLEAGADCSGEWGPWAMDGAASGGHLEVVQKLLALGASSEHAPHGAAAFVRIDILQALLDAGTDVSAFTRHVVIREAVGQGRREVVEWLLQFGASWSLDGTNTNCVTDAAAMGRVDLLRLFKEHGVSLSGDGVGSAALSAAVIRGQDEAIRFLLDEGAEVVDVLLFFGQYSKTNGDPQGVFRKGMDRLAAAGVDVEGLLVGLINEGFPQAVTSLQRYRGTIQAAGAFDWKSSVQNGWIEILVRLVKHGATPPADFPDFLAQQAQHGHNLAIDAAMGTYGDADAFDHYDWTLGAEQGHSEVIRTLLEAGKAPEGDNYVAVFVLASKTGNRGLVDLVTRKADVDEELSVRAVRECWGQGMDLGIARFFAGRKE